MATDWISTFRYYEGNLTGSLDNLDMIARNRDVPRHIRQMAFESMLHVLGQCPKDAETNLFAMLHDMSRDERYLKSQRDAALEVILARDDGEMRTGYKRFVKTHKPFGRIARLKAPLKRKR